MHLKGKPVYLDYNSTTPVDPFVLNGMLPFFTEHFGNPASRSHPYGWQADEAVEIARQKVADLISVDKQEIYFNSGATEGLNMAIKGIAANQAFKGKHIITISTEHKAVLDTLGSLPEEFETTILPVNADGGFDLQTLRDAIRPGTMMVIAMWANNETGVIHDIKSIGEICLDYGLAFICDATQAVGKIEVNAKSNNVDVLVMSSHKMYGPKGIGAIYISKNEKQIKPHALLHGGGHEKGYRSGTLNVPGIVGLGFAAELFMQDKNYFSTTVKEKRELFEKGIKDTFDHIEINGHPSHRLPSVSNIMIKHVDGQAIMTKLRTKLSISSGSACSSADPLPSHVLLAMGLAADDARSSFRFSFGRYTTTEELEYASEIFINAVIEYRSQSPAWQLFKNSTG